MYEGDDVPVLKFLHQFYFFHHAAFGLLFDWNAFDSILGSLPYALSDSSLAAACNAFSKMKLCFNQNILFVSVGADL